MRLPGLSSKEEHEQVRQWERIMSELYDLQQQVGSSATMKIYADERIKGDDETEEFRVSIYSNGQPLTDFKLPYPCEVIGSFSKDGGVMIQIWLREMYESMLDRND